MNKKFTILGTALLCSLLATPAFADLKIEYSSQQVQPRRMHQHHAQMPHMEAQQDYVTHSGNPDYSSMSHIRDGFDVPLDEAFKAIIPDNFRLIDNQVSMRKLASWKGHRPWASILTDLARSADFYAHIDWNRREVSLAPKTSQSTLHNSRQAMMHAHHVNHVAQHQGYSVKPIVLPPSYPMQPPVPNVWTLNPAFTLKENISNWARLAGWTVVWDAVDYPVVATATFSGQFNDANGPLAQIFKGFEGSEQPLSVTLTQKDRVVYVKNAVYERVEAGALPEPVSSSNL